LVRRLYTRVAPKGDCVLIGSQRSHYSLPAVTSERNATVAAGVGGEQRKLRMTVLRRGLSICVINCWM
jgi:hypothetical protein